MDGTAAHALDKPAFRKVDWLQRDIAVERRDDGVIVMQSRIPLQEYGPHIPASLRSGCGGGSGNGAGSPTAKPSARSMR